MPEPEPVVAEVPELVVPEPEPEPVVAGEVAAAEAEPEPEPVAAEVADLTEPVAAEVASVTAEVAGEVAAEAEVAACACREDASKTTRIPAATIANRTARRAMYRKIGRGMSSSRTTGTDRTRLVVPIISGPKHARRILFQAFLPWSPEPDICDPSANVPTVRSPPYSAGPRQGKSGRMATELDANSAVPDEL